MRKVENKTQQSNRKHTFAASMAMDRTAATVCLGSRFFFLFSFYALFGMLLKGMGERFLLSKDEPLTPDIDEVTAL